MHPHHLRALAAERARDLREQASRDRAAAAPCAWPEVVIRRATPADRPALARLAQLDSASPPAGAALVAVAAGIPRAVLPLDGAPAYADPFEPTAELRALLSLRARQLRRGTAQRRRLRLPRAHLR